LKARQCGGIPTIIMVLKNFLPITIAWLSPVSAEFVEKNTCSHPGIASTIWVLRELIIVFFVVRIAQPSMYP
jgi:hypothetical protein